MATLPFQPSRCPWKQSNFYFRDQMVQTRHHLNCPNRQRTARCVEETRVRRRNDGGFLQARQDLRPRTLVLCCRFQSDAELVCGAQDEMRIAHELASEKDDVRLALRQHVVRLLRRRDHAHRADRNVRVRLLDRLRKRNLQKRKREMKGARATHPTVAPIFPRERWREGEGDVPGNPAQRESSARPSCPRS